MKFLCLFALLALPAAFASVVLDPEDFPLTNVRGECLSGLPLDGRFQRCALSNDAWRIGARELGVHLSNNDISFPSDFAASPPVFEDISSSDTTQTCSISIPPSGIVFQHLNYHLYAHYRLSGCAKVRGNSPCRVEVRNWANHVVDFLEFAPSSNLSCADTGSGKEQCVRWDASSSIRYTSIAVRYEGMVPTSIAVRLLSNINDNTQDLIFMVTPGEEFNITAHELGASDFLPDNLIFLSGETGRLIDVLSLFGDGTILPGMRFGDDSQYLMAKAWTTGSMPICPVSEAADALQCPCEDANVDSVCQFSNKGFVARPDEELYIGLVSGECSCDFDNICLHQVGNEEGYFGLPWIALGSNSTL